VLTDPNHKIEFEVDSTTTHEFDTDGIKFTSSNSTGWFPCPGARQDQVQMRHQG